MTKLEHPGRTGPGQSVADGQWSNHERKAPFPTGTPRGRPRRVFAAASCKHTKDKHDQSVAQATRGLPNPEYPEVVLRHVAVRRCEGSHHARQQTMKGLNGAFAWRQEELSDDSLLSIARSHPSPDAGSDGQLRWYGSASLG